MGDRLFHYNQIGSSGLFLGWGEDAAPFFGCDLFYQLGYINEAYRWAFEALVAKGESPRILKILTLASLINGNNAVAAKFLNILDRSLFYADWAEQYRKYINDPVMLGNDPEISAKRRQLIKTDFFADVTRYDLQLTRLLENNPDNRMAFEYLISFLLLEKNLSSFSEKMKYLNDLGYKQIPVHFEEALLASDSGYEAFIPEGLSIRESTRHNFDGYVKASPAGSYSIDKRMEYLGDQYGNTFWYYYQFK